MSDSSNVAKYVLFGLTIPTCLILEHVGRLNNWALKPSIALTFAQCQFETMWKFVGVQFAKISSFLTLIDLTEFKKTLYDICTPIFGIFTSPMHVVKSYIATALTYEYKSWQIYLGSFCIFSLLMVGIWYLNKKSYLDGIKAKTSITWAEIIRRLNF